MRKSLKQKSLKLLRNSRFGNSNLFDAFDVNGNIRREFLYPKSKPSIENLTFARLKNEIRLLKKQRYNYKRKRDQLETIRLSQSKIINELIIKNEIMKDKLRMELGKKIYVKGSNLLL